MYYERIEETRKYFIEKYGEPKETKMGSFTYKFVNANLESFNNFIAAFMDVIEKLQMTDVEKQVNLICEYSKVEVPINLDKITEKLKRLILDLNKKVNYLKYGFIKMMQELEIEAQNPKFNPALVANYFKYRLQAKLHEFNIKTNRRSIDRNGDSFWGRNKGLEDNNN